MAKVDAVPELQEFMLPSDVAHRWLAAHSRGNRSAESTKWRTAHAAFKSSRGITPLQTADLPGVLREVKDLKYLTEREKDSLEANVLLDMMRGDFSEKEPSLAARSEATCAASSHCCPAVAQICFRRRHVNVVVDCILLA